MSDSTREEIEAAATFVQEWRADDDQLRIPTTDWGWELAKAIDVLTEAALTSPPAVAGEFDGDTSPEALAAWERYCALPPNNVALSAAQRDQDTFTAGFDAARRAAAAVPAPVGKTPSEELTYDSAETLAFIESFNGDEAGDVDEVGSILGDRGYAMRGGNDVLAVLKKAQSALSAVPAPAKTPKIWVEKKCRDAFCNQAEGHLPPCDDAPLPYKPWSRRAVPPVETVNTVEELDALPVETVVMEMTNEPFLGIPTVAGVFHKFPIAVQEPGREWFVVAGHGARPADDIILPARVLFRPDTEGSG